MTVYKYQGAGNDFIVIDSSGCSAELTGEFIGRICDRRFGIGADGLIVFGGSARHDFSMQFFNSDGSSGMMCGNGGRCIISYAAFKGVKPRSGDDIYVFEAPDGVHSGQILSSEGRKSTVRLKMNDVSLVEPFRDGLYMNTGCPHLVFSMASGIERMNVSGEGPRWRGHPAFSPLGTNVDWAEVRGDILRVRTFEKGVECETLACGTGVIASAIASWIRLGADSPIFTRTEDGLVKCRVRTERDTIEVEFRPTSEAPYTDIWLTGEAEQVFWAVL